MTAEVVHIAEPSTGCTASIVPSLGFNCISLMSTAGGKPWEVLWTDPLFTTGTQRPSRSGIPILFPFPGRIRGAKFEYQGRTYELDTSDGQGNAIHGFVYVRPWRVIEQGTSSITGEFQASIDDPSVLKRWPTDFRLRATYTLRGCELHCDYAFTNLGSEPCPWGFGLHQYFRLPLAGGDKVNCFATMPVTTEWELQQLVPTGRAGPVPNATELQEGVPVAHLKLDNVYGGLLWTDGAWTGTVEDRVTGRQVSIRTTSTAFRECVAFTPPHGEAICLEPYSCVPNPFELEAQGVESGLQFLAPGATQELNVVIATK